MYDTCQRTLHVASTIGVLTCLLVVPTARGQIPFSLGGSGRDRTRDVVYDGQNHVFVAGNISSAVDFDPGSGEFILTPLGVRSGFVAKMTRDGELVWAFLLSGSVDGLLTDFEIGPGGDIFICGHVKGTIDLDPGLGNKSYSSLDDFDSFVARYTPNGELVWGFGLPGLGYDAPTWVAVDSDKNIYVTGTTVSSADFDPGVGEHILTSQGGRDLFIARYDSLGNLDWAHLFGTTGDDTGRALTVNTDSSICIVADFHYSFDLDPGPGSAIVSNDGALDALIASFGLDGTYKWSYALSASGYSQFAGLDTDNQGNCYASGWFSGSVDFEPGSGITSKTSHGDWDIATVKYGPSGNLKWVHTDGGIGQDRAHRVSVGANGRVYTSGYFGDRVDFGISGGAYDYTSRGEGDAFVTVLDTSGAFEAAYRLGGALSDEATYARFIDSTTVLVVGGFRGDISLAADSLFSEGDMDAFVARLSDLVPTDVTVDVRAFLEGPYVAGAMWPSVLHLTHVPMSQPYGGATFQGTPLFHDGSESIGAVVDSLVDWVEIGLRHDPEVSPDVARRAALLFRSGAIRDLDGTSPVRFDHVGREAFYVVVRHRNHLPVMSSDTLATSDGHGSWDFRTSLDSGFSRGSPPLKSLGNGAFGLAACDGNSDGLITATDFNLWNLETTAGQVGYIQSDCDLDGQATATDFNVWNANTTSGQATQVPD